MNPQERNELKEKIARIFEIGASETLVFETMERYIDLILKLKLENQKEQIRQYLINDGYDMLAEKI